MATELLVEERIEDGRRVVEQLVRDGFEVAAAFWLKSGEEGLWHLYIASPAVDAERPGEAFREVFGSLCKVPRSSVEISNIKLIHVSNPIAQEVIRVRERFPANTRTRFGGKRVDHVSIEEAYIYPSAVDRSGEPLGGLIQYLRDHRDGGLGINPQDYRKPDGRPFDDEQELIDYWTDLLGRVAPQPPVG